MKKIISLASLLCVVACNNPVQPDFLIVDPSEVTLSVGQSRVFKITGLNGHDFRVFTGFQGSESVCYYDCDPDSYGDIERLGPDTFRYKLRKGRDPAAGRVIELRIYPSDRSTPTVTVLVYVI